MIQVRLKTAKPPFPLLNFTSLPSWNDLCSNILALFQIPSNRVILTVRSDSELETPFTDLTNDGELQKVYESLKEARYIKFVVQDSNTPDSIQKISATWSADSNLSDLAENDRPYVSKRRQENQPDHHPCKRPRMGPDFISSTGENNLKQLEGFKLGPLSRSQELLQVADELYTQIQLLSDDPAMYSDPRKIFDLPFPSSNNIPPRFSLLDTKRISYMPGRISYMGRECFSQVWDAFCKTQSDSFHRQAIYVYGPKGFGKSHIFAALACLLIRKGEKVIYLPDCRQMLRNPLDYLQNAFSIGFANSTAAIRKHVQECQSFQSLIDFCKEYRSIGRLCFIIDQANALDMEPMGCDTEPNYKKEELRNMLELMSTNHIEITSASANHKTFKHMAMKDTGERKVHLMGGMTPLEMSCWWKYHDFKALSTKDKQRVEDLTGCIPLLLNPFVKHHEETLENLETHIWEDEVLESVHTEIISWANKQKKELDQRTFYDQFVLPMRTCLQGGKISDSGSYIDYRYFYLDSKRYGRYSCGLAREAITEFLRINREESIFLGDEWNQTLRAFKNNPSVIGFTVEQIVISKLACTGLHSGKLDLHAGKIVTFQDRIAWLSKAKQPRYYVPVRFNLKAIDVLYVSLDLKTKVAEVVAIQITVAKQHKDSVAAFFADWSEWISGLSDFTINAKFVWIHDGFRGQCEVEEKLKELRTRTAVVCPHHTVHWVSIEQVDVQLARTLTWIQPGS